MGGDKQCEILIERALNVSGGLVAQVNLWKEYAGGDSQVSWQLLENIEKICQKIYHNVRIDCDEFLGGVKVYASPLAPKVFENLIDNSLRHGGATRIWTSHEFSSQGDLVIIYEDDGCGIPQKDKELIFSEGFGKNTGLGLFFVREILRITNIEIIEDGEPGKGARFKITIPKDYYRQQ